MKWAFFLFFQNRNTPITPFLMSFNTHPRFRSHVQISLTVEKTMNRRTHLARGQPHRRPRQRRELLCLVHDKWWPRTLGCHAFPTWGLNQNDEAWDDGWGKVKWRGTTEFYWAQLHARFCEAMHALPCTKLLSFRESYWNWMVKLLRTSSLIS